MKHIRYILLSIILVAGGLAYGPASAALPSFAADLEQGQIDRVDMKTGEIVIDDSYFVLPLGVRVYTLNGAPASASSLAEGMTIGYGTAEDASGQSAVAKIVILSGN